MLTEEIPMVSGLQKDVYADPDGFFADRDSTALVASPQSLPPSLREFFARIRRDSVIGFLGDRQSELCNTSSRSEMGSRQESGPWLARQGPRFGQ
jgi:hypothetical protein